MGKGKGMSALGKWREDMAQLLWGKVVYRHIKIKVVER